MINIFLFIFNINIHYIVKFKHLHLIMNLTYLIKMKDVCMWCICMKLKISVTAEPIYWALLFTNKQRPKQCHCVKNLSYCCYVRCVTSIVRGKLQDKTCAQLKLPDKRCNQRVGRKKKKRLLGSKKGCRQINCPLPACEIFDTYKIKLRI